MTPSLMNHPPQIVARMTQPEFFCRKHTITRSRDQPLHKVDAVQASPSKTGPQSDGYNVWMWARQNSERQLSILDAHRGTFKGAEVTLPGGRARATMVISNGDSRRVWVSTVVSVGVWLGWGCGFSYCVSLSSSHPVPYHTPSLINSTATK